MTTHLPGPFSLVPFVSVDDMMKLMGASIFDHSRGCAAVRLA